METVGKGDLLKGVGVEVGCEGFGAVERKARSRGQEAGAACPEAPRRGNWHGSLDGCCFVRDGQSSCLTVELQGGPSMGSGAALLGWTPSSAM